MTIMRMKSAGTRDLHVPSMSKADANGLEALQAWLTPARGPLPSSGSDVPGQLGVPFLPASGEHDAHRPRARDFMDQVRRCLLPATPPFDFQRVAPTGNTFRLSLAPWGEELWSVIRCSAAESAARGVPGTSD